MYIYFYRNICIYIDNTDSILNTRFGHVCIMEYTQILCLLWDYEATKSLPEAGQRMSSHLLGVFPASPSQGCPSVKADKFTSLPGAPSQRNGTDAFQ